MSNSNQTESSSSQERRRVVVTGMGIASALGIDESTVWENLTEGRTGVGPLRAIDTSDYKVKIGAEVPEGLVEEKLKELRRRPIDRALDLAVVAAYSALTQANLLTGEAPWEEQDVAVIFGTGEGSAQSHHTAFNSFFKKGPRGMRPTTVPRCMYNAISAGLSLQFKLTGTNYMIVSACTSATNAMGTAYRMIRDGYAETVLCGGADGFFDPFFFGVWNNIPALSKIPDPLKACRPFAEDRDGTVLGEGAGAFVLESHERAVDRDASIRGEILGYGESSDATHLTSPSVEGQAKAMRLALNEANVQPEEISFINAHGTATKSNDACESQSIRAVFGDATDQVPVIANKSFFGHTLGASGALESIVSLLALEKGTAPPNLNLENRDPECNLNLVGSEPVSIKRAPAMKNSFGFGGGNGVLILGPAN
ncbi:MAG: beta-ketoacyl-[acyl-carrier-protein] synthase family protein [Verrucomicrobia bacterium]|nr:beta-ketoacyl-[acyl-carrier-protein] synthase family protein [Verrucomicrobiota bacterium]